MNNDMNNVMCYMNYDMCYVYAVVNCVQNVMYDGACYSHGITFLIQIWKANNLSLSKYGKLTHFPNLHLASPVTWPSTIMLLGKRYSYSCMSLVCACIYPYLVQVCTNPIQLYNFRCRHRWTLKLQVDAETIRTWSIHPDLVGPHPFKDACPLYSSLVIGLR